MEEKINELFKQSIYASKHRYVAAIERYMEWVSRHEHLDSALHQQHVENLEQQWRHNYKDASNDALGYVPHFVFNDASATMWDGNGWNFRWISRFKTNILGR